jgi:hypothetical protein
MLPLLLGGDSLSNIFLLPSKALSLEFHRHSLDSHDPMPNILIEYCHMIDTEYNRCH